MTKGWLWSIHSLFFVFSVGGIVKNLILKEDTRVFALKHFQVPNPEEDHIWSNCRKLL